ncbi:MAG: 1,4-alpha-glucan branching protein GlgB [Gammaproteobacteria bacterium]|jgi:1,4-alpha-glucan branching enzyme|nr:1,4-alpha-glucan branching protein GlgB [Gammaproteobacteria bacterium]
MQPLQADGERHAADFAALAAGRHRDVFAVLGLHRVGATRLVRVYVPGARSVTLLTDADRQATPMPRLHDAGVFVAEMPRRRRRYRLRIEQPDGSVAVCEDPYAFPVSLGELDLYLLREGSHRQIYSILGAQPMALQGCRGTRFAVWAPNAGRVSVVGDFNHWDGRRHVMRLHPGNGIWEIFLPGVRPGAHYKFEVTDRAGNLLPLKTDPMAHYFEAPPGNAAIVYASRYAWLDAEWMRRRSAQPRLDTAVSIYEVHLGSWRRKPEEHDRPLSYRELADELVSYVVDMGFTHVELLPVTEHPFDGSWGYQPIGLFAPTQRYGEPDDFRYLVDRCHQAGIGVILDWVSAHFPRDEHGLVRFDGTALYEHEDPRRGEHADWGTLIFNYGRREVVNYLIGSALYWVEEFHIDALRVDAVASMLYLDYSREAGEWLPNQFGGNENLEAVAFLCRLNEILHAHGATTYAEESTAWPGVSRPTYAGGLGFTYKWNMGWMHDTLKYIEEDPVHRRYHHDKMTFGLIYAFDENFVLPLSHDEVVHGKRSLLAKMPGDDWQKFANLRAYLAAMYAHPGKKLLFMGAEFAQRREWSHQVSLDWHLLEQGPHAGMTRLVKALNATYIRQPALHEVDFSPAGFEWIEINDAENSILAWLRRGADGGFVVCVTNFTPVVRHDYALGVPAAGPYVELLNTDAGEYGGTGLVHPGERVAHATGAHGRPYSLCITLPPLATVMFSPAHQSPVHDLPGKP